ncbi:hypothetical protein Tco_0449033 [Tanacetum coccineum]
MQTKTELTLEQNQQDAPVRRTASAVAKPCQGDSSEFYQITGNIYTDKRGTMVFPMVTSTQDGKRSQDDDKRLYLADDLKEAQNHMQVKLKGTSSSLKSKDRYTYHKLKDNDSRPRAKTKDIYRM